MLLEITRIDIPEGGSIVIDGAISDFHVKPGDFFCAAPEQKTVTVHSEFEQKTVTPGELSEKNSLNSLNVKSVQKTVTPVRRLQLNIDGFAIYTVDGMVVGATSFSSVELPFVKSMQDAGNNGVSINSIRDKRGDMVDDGYARRLKNTIENKLLDANIPFFVRSEIIEKIESGRTLHEKYFYLEPLTL